MKRMRSGDSPKKARVGSRALRVPANLFVLGVAPKAQATWDGVLELATSWFVAGRTSRDQMRAKLG
jgi:hypothetical protein